MESFINEFLTSEYDQYDAVSTAEEVLLNRRISPYATLRPGDLAALVKFHNGQLLNHPALCCGSSLPDICDEEEDDGKSQIQESSDVTLRGEDQGHVPAQYVVKGVRHHEMAVAGVCIDSRICPGFRYRVRRAGSSTNGHLWSGKARTLLSMGMGYGRRLTFEDDQLNNNECYFWSDSEPAGYAFSIHTVDAGQNFLIQSCVDGAVLGEAIVEANHEPQEEISMETPTKGQVTKRVAVTLTCRVTYYHRHSPGLLELMANEDEETVSGQAVLVRSRPGAQATLQSVEGVFLPRLGDCKFVPDMC